MERVTGHKGWWNLGGTQSTGSYQYVFFSPMGKRSDIFIYREDKPGRRQRGYKYEVFHAGKGVKGTALPLSGFTTLANAIKEANLVRKRVE
jgi:hypothetical protein